MGLDIHFYKQKRLDGREKKVCKHLESKYKELSKAIVHLEDLGNNDATLDKLYAEKKKCSLDVRNLTEFSEVAYFRKVNFLVRHFGYEENLSEVLISREDIESLVEKCKLVLENHELARDLLPTIEGFFFGSLEYDELYFEDVEEVLHEFERILSETNFDTHEIRMWCWW